MPSEHLGLFCPLGPPASPRAAIAALRSWQSWRANWLVVCIFYGRGRRFNVDGLAALLMVALGRCHGVHLRRFSIYPIERLLCIIHHWRLAWILSIYTSSLEGTSLLTGLFNATARLPKAYPALRPRLRIGSSAFGGGRDSMGKWETLHRNCESLSLLFLKYGRGLFWSWYL